MRKLATVFVLLLPTLAWGYSLEPVASTTTVVADSQRATAYYGKLEGDPHVFTLSEAEPFTLYMNVLVPDIPGQKQDVNVAVVDPQMPGVPLGVIVAGVSPWERTNYNGDAYLRGPEYRATLPPGTYEIRLWSSNNDSRFVLVVGEREPNVFARFWNALSVLPSVKSGVFGESPAAAYLAPIIFVPIALGILIVALTIRLLRRSSQS